MTFGNILILGDSYSTFAGLIPEGFDPCYPNELIDVKKAEETWWMQLVNDTNSNIVLNSSFSGTTFCNTGYEGRDVSDISFIARLDKLISEGFFEKENIDTLFIFGGTNDSWAGSPIGEIKYTDFTREELYNVLPAFSYLLNKVKNNTNIKQTYVIINTLLREEIENGVIEICKHYGVKYILLNDISKVEGHPDVLGMTQIKDQIINNVK